MNIAYHWNRNARPILCMPMGITFTASAISAIVARGLLDDDRICASSCSLGVISLVRIMARPTVMMAQTAPNQKTTNTQVGTPASEEPVRSCWKTYSDTFASTAPAPVNMLWIRKPLGICDLRSRSEISARYGSMEVLFPASTSQRQTTAIHSAVTNGKRNRMAIITTAPPRMYGLRFPHLGLHVLSLIAPMNGWINKPVIGPAMLRIGRLCASAPKNKKMGFTALWVSPKLNWTPKNPRFIQAMLPVVISGRRSSSASSSVGCATFVVAIETAPSRSGPQRVQGRAVGAVSRSPAPLRDFEDTTSDGWVPSRPLPSARKSCGVAHSLSTPAQVSNC